MLLSRDGIVGFFYDYILLYFEIDFILTVHLLV
jgi:hypothetical protein